MITKRERMVLAVLAAVAHVEGWETTHPSVGHWRTGEPVPSKELRKQIAWYERYYTPKLEAQAR